MSLLRILREQKGTVAVLTALAITSLLGFTALVVDIGVLYINKTQLVNMADAAALAGVQDLPADDVSAEKNAAFYAAQNGNLTDVVNTTVGSDNKTITVTAKRTVALFFARVFAVNSSEVTATAVAAVRPISGVSGAVPFGIVKQDFIYGKTYLLKDGGGSGYDGNYGPLALGGTGASNYVDKIKYGYSGKLAIGQWVPTETGNMSGPTGQGVSYRIGLDSAAGFETVAKDSPRIVIVPVIDSLAVEGRTDVEIVGFAAFFLEGTGGTGTDNYVYGKFIQEVVPGDITGSSAGYGLYGATLIQ